MQVLQKILGIREGPLLGDVIKIEVETCIWKLLLDNLSSTLEKDSSSPKGRNIKWPGTRFSYEM